LNWQIGFANPISIRASDIRGNLLFFLDQQEVVMKKSRAIWYVMVVLLVLLGSGAWAALAYAKKPINTPLNINIPANNAPVKMNASLNSAPAQETFCNESGAIVILFVATDMNIWDLPHTTDFIRFVRVDFSQQKVDSVALPRDLWVQTAEEMKKNAIDNYRLGEVYYYQEQRTTGTDKEVMIASTNLLAQTLYDNFLIEPDLYITVKGDSLKTMMDTVGGVDVVNPAEFTFKDQVFNAGNIHLDGESAVLYMRWMGPETEWNRFARQKQVITAMWKKLIDPANMLKIPGWITDMSEKYVTDLSPVRITNLVCALDKIKEENITILEITPDMVTPGPNNTLLIQDIELVRAFLKGILNP
jgi:LCP family protein required for cell wall assembly